MLTAIQKMKVENVIATCKTEKGVRMMRKMAEWREFEDIKFSDQEFNGWLEYCKREIEYEGL